MGGLGNQLFQYAAGRNLASRNKTELVLDLSFLNKKKDSTNFTNRDFALASFNINARVEEDFAGKYLGEGTGLFGRIKKRLLNYPVYYYYSLEFDPTFFSFGKRVILEGYFQSEKYFSEIKDVLQRELTLRYPVVHAGEQGGEEETVGIHFRRGDFANLQSAASFNGVCDPGYYRKAIDLVKQKLANPVFCIFSDDIQWVKDNFRIDAAHRYIENKGPDAALKDFDMLKNCRHQVIANSTFSWWAAWLNPYKEKIVIAPRQWLADPGIKHDIIPEQWIKL